MLRLLVALCWSSVAVAQGAGVVVETLPHHTAPDAALPTVIALHGRGGNAAAFAGFVRRLAPNARVISLQAPTYLGNGYTWLRTRVAHRDAAKVTSEVQAALTELRPRLREVLRSTPSCGQPVLVGFSQGGVLALALAAERFEGVAAFVDLAGALPKGFPVVTAGTATPVFSLHARDDATVPVAATRRALKSLRASGVPVNSVEVTGGHDATDELRAEAKRALASALRAACPVK